MSVIEGCCKELV